MSRLPVVHLLALAAIAACGSPSPEAPAAVVPLVAPPEGRGFQLEMTATAKAGTEAWICAVYPAPNRDLANVQWVEYQQNPGMHHLTLSTVFASDAIPVGEGVYNCDQVYSGRFMKEQIMMFGGQGEADGTLNLPPGIVAKLPPQLMIVHEVHFVNTTTRDIDLYSRVNVWTIPSSQVSNGIWGGSVRDEHISIPAAAPSHVEWSRCAMNRDVDVHFLASHMHGRGVEFTIARWDGKTTGEVFYRNDDWHNPKVTKIDPPFALKKGEGFEFACRWRNVGDRPVSYGLTADDEMCNMAVVFTPDDTTAACTVVETSDGILPP